MPFKFEKERIFQSGVALKRIRKDSRCTIVVDNDALLDSNPDLTQKQCYDISNKAIENMMPVYSNLLRFQKDIKHFVNK